MKGFFILITVLAGVQGAFTGDLDQCGHRCGSRAIARAHALHVSTIFALLVSDIWSINASPMTRSGQYSLHTGIGQVNGSPAYNVSLLVGPASPSGTRNYTMTSNYPDKIGTSLFSGNLFTSGDLFPGIISIRLPDGNYSRQLDSLTLSAIDCPNGNTDNALVGFIGLGNMGAPMARNVAAAGHKMVLYDINTPDALAQEIGNGANVAQSPGEVAAQCDTIITMLPSSPHVKQVYEDAADGLIASARPGSLFIDASTIDPGVAREVASAVEKAGCHMVDAPVSGGVGGAAAATLTFMVGGSQRNFESARPVLDTMGANIVHCGEAGNGQVVKICNNMVLAISMVGVSEAYNLGVSLGMDPKVLAGIFNTSSARCWSSDTYNPVPGVMDGVPASNGYQGGFGVDLMAKDVSLAVGAAHSVKASVPLGSAALQVYNLISKHGYSQKDFSSIYEYLAKKGDQ